MPMVKAEGATQMETDMISKQSLKTQLSPTISCNTQTNGP
jgi:hypothetical protein